MQETLVIQSHAEPLPADWMRPCLDSTERWAAERGYGYRFIGDELFDPLPDNLLPLSRTQPVVASDLARLLALRAALDEGRHTVIWCDADVLICDPDRLLLPDNAYGLGREVWIENVAGHNQPRAYIKVHNAFMYFRADNVFLDFYIDASARLLERHGGPYPPQFIGPKLLTALHNIIQCPVVETAGVLSPAVVHDVLDGGGPALERFRRDSREAPAAVNLCRSLNAAGATGNGQLEQLIERLLADPGILAPGDISCRDGGVSDLDVMEQSAWN